MGLGGSVARIGRLLSELVGFATPRAHAINFGTILVILAAVPTSGLHYVPVRSVWENVFGIRPYSSGMMRSLSLVLHGDPRAAWAMNPLGFPALAVIVSLFVLNLVRWVRRSRHDAKDRRPLGWVRARDA